ncbi:MAG: hypothetical protein AB1607_10410 [Chloroflexota bacterium]
MKRNRGSIRSATITQVCPTTEEIMNLQSLLKTLVEAESPSHDKAAVGRVGFIVAEEARKLGGQVEVIPNVETGDHVLARFESPSSSGREVRGEGEKGILILCHMDTVFPLGTIQKNPLPRRGRQNIRSRRAGYESGDRDRARRNRISPTVRVESSRYAALHVR